MTVSYSHLIRSGRHLVSLGPLILSAPPIFPPPPTPGGVASSNGNPRPGHHGRPMASLPRCSASGDSDQVPPGAHGAPPAEEDHAPAGGHVQQRQRHHSGERRVRGSGIGILRETMAVGASRSSKNEGTGTPPLVPDAHALDPPLVMVVASYLIYGRCSEKKS